MRSGSEEFLLPAGGARQARQFGGGKILSRLRA